ncbi:hypothetical protein ACFVT1_13090 [Streptomyces sp. NPDC057963]|uniref:hypothetical protein n=1 Tax=Streptomyces sp. NPDC057963 TaxID=3346290 RepID=UPI0036E6A2DA
MYSAQFGFISREDAMIALAEPGIDQSVAGPAQRGGRIYGSTTVYGGLGTDATESEAKMFVWDVAGERKVKEFTLDLPGLDSPKMISGLSFGRDGLLWGAADGFLFAMDPDTLQVVSYKNVYPEVKNYGMWRPVYLRWGADGLLYTTLASKLTVVDPKTMDHVTLGDYDEEVAFMTPARDADGHENIYFLGKTAESRLRMLPVRHGLADAVAVDNAGFEVAPPDDGAVPGWQGGGTLFALSQERAYTGRRSMKIADAARSGPEASAELTSEPVPTAAGAYYRARAKVYIEDGSTDDSVLLLSFLDGAGRPDGERTAPQRGPAALDRRAGQRYGSAWYGVGPRLAVLVRVEPHDRIRRRGEPSTDQARVTPARGHRATATVRRGPVSSMRRSALAVELAPHGITADTLALGTVRTPIDGAFPFGRDAFEMPIESVFRLAATRCPTRTWARCCSPRTPVRTSTGPGSSWTAACSPNRCIDGRGEGAVQGRQGCASSAPPRTRRTTLSSATLW